jgi:hypothetical protein
MVLDDFVELQHYLHWYFDQQLVVDLDLNVLVLHVDHVRVVVFVVQLVHH